jgi:dihydropteroate synthase
VDEEMRRVVPVIAALSNEKKIILSVDTVKPEVAKAAINAGARIVNDVSCGQSDDLLRVVASSGVDLVVMHNRSDGRVAPPNTLYHDLIREVTHEIFAVVQRATELGVSREHIWIDPGLGFAKTGEQSMVLLAFLRSFVGHGHRILVGPSRKGFIAEYGPSSSPSKIEPRARDAGTAVIVADAIGSGAHGVRVHDVASMRQAAMIAEAMLRLRNRRRSAEVCA